MSIKFHALPTEEVARIRASGTDANGQPLERHISDGTVHPCRHCLGNVPEGAAYYILAHRPFQGLNPYTETGPIFLCADDCAAHAPGPDMPDTLTAPTYLIRGYGPDERIVYGTGGVVDTDRVAARAAEILSRSDIAFVDLRSAANNCWQARITRD